MTGATGIRRSGVHGNAVGREYRSPYGSGLLLAMLCLVLLAAPLPLGANRAWSWTVLESALFFLVLVWVFLSIGGRGRSDGVTVARPCFVAVALWLLWAAVYLVPLPGALVHWLAPDVHSGYQQVHEMLSPGQAYFLTIDRHATLQALLKYGMYAAALFLVVALATSRARLTLLLATVLASGVLQVLVALWARTAGVELTPRALMDGHWDVLRGTFVNRNHFAAFLAMTAAAGIGLTLARLKRPRGGGSFRAWIAGILDNLEGPVLLGGLAVVTVGAGMILSTSRGGVAALGGAIVVTLALALLARGWRAREMVLVWPLSLAVLVALAWRGSRSLLDRLATSGLVIEERWVQWDGTWRLILDHWLTGTGPGTYRYAFTAYKDAALRPLLYDHAHNDYLQVLAEHGVVGGVLLAAALLTLFFILIRSFMKRSDMFVRGALFASLTGMLAMLIHSLVEFNFQIPANALYFWVLAGAGLAAARLGRGENGGYGHRVKGGSTARGKRE